MVLRSAKLMPPYCFHQVEGEELKVATLPGPARAALKGVAVSGLVPGVSGLPQMQNDRWDGVEVGWRDTSKRQ